MGKQKGALLIELAVVLAIMTLITAGSVHWMAQRAEQTKIESLAVWMLGVQQGLQSFLDTYADSLQQDASFVLPEVRDLMQPTLAELKQLGFLTPSFVIKDGVNIQLYKEGVCPGPLCHVQGLVYSAQPLLNKQHQADYSAMAQWQMKVKGAGLIVSAQDPDYFVGSQLRIAHQRLPLASYAEGTVALLVSTDASLIQRGGLRPDRNPNFTADVDVDGNLTVSQDIQAGRYLLMPHTETLGEPCSQNGAVARGVDNKGLMSCENQVWIRPAADLSLLESYREILERYWKISIPETPGGFYARAPMNFTYHCWVPNPLNLYQDGRGVCACATPYKTKRLAVIERVKDYYFENGIERPELTVFICIT